MIKHLRRRPGSGDNNDYRHAFTDNGAGYPASRNSSSSGLKASAPSVPVITALFINGFKLFTSWQCFPNAIS